MIQAVRNPIVNLRTIKMLRKIAGSIATWCHWLNQNLLSRKFWSALSLLPFRQNNQIFTRPWQGRSSSLLASYTEIRKDPLFQTLKHYSQSTGRKYEYKQNSLLIDNICKCYLKKKTFPLYSNANIVRNRIIKQSHYGLYKIHNGRNQSRATNETRTVQHLRFSILDDIKLETLVQKWFYPSQSNLEFMKLNFFEQLWNNRWLASIVKILIYWLLINLTYFRYCWTRI